jgi:dienelactone hydrolase
MKTIVLILSLALLPLTAGAAVKTDEVSYLVGDKEFTGYLTYDDATESRRPGVLVVHEWWGHNAYARKRAEMLAELGYTAFALDMYGTGKLAEHPDDAKAFMQAVTANMPEAEKRFAMAKAVLQSHPTVDPDRVAAIGYCFGGGIVLHMARTGIDLDGVVSLLDVGPFVDLISLGQFQAEGDINQDGMVNLLDVDPFVALLGGG